MLIFEYLSKIRPVSASRRPVLFVYFVSKKMGTGEEAINRLIPDPTLSRAQTCKLLKGPGIDSKESIPPAYAAWQAGTKTLFLLGSLPP